MKAIGPPYKRKRLRGTLEWRQEQRVKDKREICEGCKGKNRKAKQNKKKK